MNAEQYRALVDRLQKIQENTQGDEDYHRTVEYTKKYMAHHHLTALASEDVDAIATELGLPIDDVKDYLYDVGLSPHDPTDDEEGGYTDQQVAAANSALQKIEELMMFCRQHHILEDHVQNSLHNSYYAIETIAQRM